jgi:hypothetical protein
MNKMQFENYTCNVKECWRLSCTVAFNCNLDVKWLLFDWFFFYWLKKWIDKTKWVDFEWIWPVDCKVNLL